MGKTPRGVAATTFQSWITGNPMKYMAPAALMMVALFVAAFPGCASKSTESVGSSTPAMTEGHGDQVEDGGTGQSEMEKVKAELAKLSPEDAASAEAQHVCPVSSEMLGTMGAPKKLDVDGQQVWICCDGCKDTLLRSPDEYLAKLKKQ